MTLARLIRPLAFAVALALPAASARAQDADPNAPPGTESEGNPVPGYIATAVLACGAIFVLCKSARR